MVQKADLVHPGTGAPEDPADAEGRGVFADTLRVERPGRPPPGAEGAVASGLPVGLDHELAHQVKPAVHAGVAVDLGDELVLGERDGLLSTPVPAVLQTGELVRSSRS